MVLRCFSQLVGAIVQGIGNCRIGWEKLLSHFMEGWAVQEVMFHCFRFFGAVSTVGGDFWVDSVSVCIEKAVA